MAGGKLLSNELDRIRIAPAAPNTFDAGFVCLTIERMR